MDFTCGYPPGPSSIEWARCAEELGYGRVYLHDSPALYWDVWVTLARVADRFRPVIWWMLPLLLATGTVLIIGEPTRELGNWIFQLKMLLLVSVVALLLVFQRPLARDPQYWDAHRRGARLLAIVSLILWCGIIFAGRWIAYL